MDRIGRVYVKALYREYTDASFTRLKPRPPEWAHLGSLGPVLRAAVGDTIRVTFRNNAGFPCSIHPHGVFYTRENEGVPAPSSSDDTHMMGGNEVMPGETFTYLWQVPERAGPGLNDPSSIAWLYHSHVNEVWDVNAGLVGAILVSGSAAAATGGRPADVDREFVVFFSIVNENLSWYMDRNIDTYLPAITNDTAMEALRMDTGFQESNLMHAVNGYVYANLPGLAMRVGERVRWHVISLGDEQDLHGVHWHGATLLSDGHRVDAIELIPASMKTLDMVPDDVGRWLLHCHTDHHVVAGMTALYAVSPSPTTDEAVHQISSGSRVAAHWLHSMLAAVLAFF